MIVLHGIGFLGVIMMVSAIIIIKFVVKKYVEEGIIASFINLLKQSINGFNRRLFFIFLQFILLSNVLIISFFWIQKKNVDLQYIIGFDASIIIFSGIIYVLSHLFFYLLSETVRQDYQSIKPIVRSILWTGFFQMLSFFGVFFIVIYGSLILFDWYALLSISIGMLVVAYYYRLAGGAFKAAAECGSGNYDNDDKILTHPAALLVKTGQVIAGFCGYYLDIFSSWIIAITAFFGYLGFSIKQANVSALLIFPEVQLVLAMILFTGTSILLSIPYTMVRKKLSNIYVESGYFIIGFTFVQLVGFIRFNSLENGLMLVFFMLVALISMVGIAFFSNYLTSTKLGPIRFISNQAQYGGAYVLISALFNGLIGNAIFILMLVIMLVILYKYAGVLALLMMVIYALSIAVVVCSIKVFYVISDQVESVFELEGNPIIRSFSKSLHSISYTLVTIGNSFSSAAGLLSSLLLFIPVVLLFDVTIVSIDFLFGFCLGGIIILVFYGFVISGTYKTSIQSLNEISRQLTDIPLIDQKNKAHPNVIKLSDQHSLNGLGAVTLSGSWILISLVSIYCFLSLNGVYGCLMGIFLVVFIQSFFWSIFGDSVAAVHTLMKEGLYGGSKTAMFHQMRQSYLYAHYFQWLLAPTGIIIMKLVGMISFLLLLL